MTRTEQRRFVRELSRNVVRNMLSKSNKWPANWDGHELRRLLALAFDYGVIGDMGRKRSRDFKKNCIINNLP